MLKVDEKKFFEELEIYKERLAKIEENAKDEVAKLGASIETKAKIYDMLVAEYSADCKSKIDYLMAFVVETEEPKEEVGETPTLL